MGHFFEYKKEKENQIFAAILKKKIKLSRNNKKKLVSEWIGIYQECKKETKENPYFFWTGQICRCLGYGGNGGLCGCSCRGGTAEATLQRASVTGDGL